MNNIMKSKLSIGSAQFGQNYGITNHLGKTKFEQIIEILDLAKKNNVDTIDTAISYGDSEETLGRACVDDFNIVTKLPSLETIRSNYYLSIREMINKSIKRLKINQLDYVLLHRAEDLLGTKGKRVIKALLKLKESNIVKNIGLSIYSPNVLDQIECLSEIDIVQSPLNVFDKRIVSSGWLSRLKDMNITFHARSVFLQGLLLSDIDQIPKYFSPWASNFNKWQFFVDDLRVTKLSAALKYVTEIKEVDKVIVGCEDVRQFSEILQTLRNINQYKTKFCGLSSSDEGLINPSNWR